MYSAKLMSEKERQSRRRMLRLMLTVEQEAQRCALLEPLMGCDELERACDRVSVRWKRVKRLRAKWMELPWWTRAWLWYRSLTPRPPRVCPAHREPAGTPAPPPKRYRCTRCRCQIPTSAVAFADGAGLMCVACEKRSRR